MHCKQNIKAQDMFVTIYGKLVYLIVRVSVFDSDGLWSRWVSNYEYTGLRKVCKDSDENRQIKLFVYGLKSQNNGINTDSIATCCLLDDCSLISNRTSFSSPCSGLLQNVVSEKNRKKRSFITVYNSVTSVPIYVLSTRFLLLYFISNTFRYHEPETNEIK